MAALVKYKYLGLSSVVEVDYATPQVKLDLYGGTPGTYTGLDRFGRVINHPWINYGASPEEDVARIQHGYDRNSNRLWRQNDVARALSKKFDQQYTYDGLNRLTDAKTGLLDGSHVIPPGSDTTFQQQWSLDYVGNWSAFNQDDDGGGTFDLQQTRTANPVNEITDIAATTGPTWTTPQYDPAGNTTSFPKPAAPSESFTAVYDAWNRMVRVIDNETDDIVQENVYDGRNYRIIKKTYDAGVLDETRHIYYTSSWQAIEERLGTDPDSADPAQQYVWGIRYIDDLVLRDRDTSEPPDGVLNERLYAIQDPNWNVTTIIDGNGDVQERYEYEAYGKQTNFAPDGSLRLSTAQAWTRLYQSQCQDNLTSLQVVRHRVLQTILGKWSQRDAMGYVDAHNLYAFVRCSPINYVDPYGLDSVSSAMAFGKLLSLWRDIGRGPETSKTTGFTALVQRIQGGILNVEHVNGGSSAGTAGEYQWDPEKFLWPPTGPADGLTVLHESIHYIDYHSKWYIPHNLDKAEELAWSAEALVWANNLIAGVESDISRQMPYDKIQSKWSSSWHSINTNLKSNTVTYNSGKEVPVTLAMVSDVGAKLKFIVSCKAIREALMLSYEMRQTYYPESELECLECPVNLPAEFA